MGAYTSAVVCTGSNLLCDCYHNIYNRFINWIQTFSFNDGALCKCFIQIDPSVVSIYLNFLAYTHIFVTDARMYIYTYRHLSTYKYTLTHIQIYYRRAHLHTHMYIYTCTYMHIWILVLPTRNVVHLYHIVST